MLQRIWDGELAEEAIRIIDVPFEVSPSGAIEIESISDSVFLELPTGNYQLRFECYACTHGAVPGIRLFFSRNDDSYFAIVRADPELSPGKELLRTASAS